MEKKSFVVVPDRSESTKLESPRNFPSRPPSVNHKKEPQTPNDNYVNNTQYDNIQNEHYLVNSISSPDNQSRSRNNLRSNFTQPNYHEYSQNTQSDPAQDSKRFYLENFDSNRNANYEDFNHSYQNKRMQGDTVKKLSALQMMNDLNILNELGNESDSAGPNVHFDFGSETIKFHSLILLVRSAWFRRSWRKCNDPTLRSNEYDFSFKSNKNIHGLDLELKQVHVPELVNGCFKFEVACGRNEDSKKQKEFIAAFKQFKNFLYRGVCEIHETNSKYLVAYSHLFQVEILNKYLSDYLRKTSSRTNVDGLFERLELAHIYNMKELKEDCIKIINSIAFQVINSAGWKKIADKYPELVFEVFRKN